MYFHLSVLNLGVQFQSLLQNIYYINMFFCLDQRLMEALTMVKNSLFQLQQVVKTPHDSPGYNPT